MTEDPEDFDDDYEEPEYLGDRRFFEFVDLGGLPPAGTVAGKAGPCPERPAYLSKPTSLVLNVEKAWRTPYAELTCGQVSELLFQKMALEPLAESILDFATRYPAAMIRNYPGEIGVGVLRAAPDFLRLAPKRFRAWLEGDFSWMDEAFSFSKSLRREAEDALGAARALVAAR